VLAVVALGLFAEDRPVVTNRGHAALARLHDGPADRRECDTKAIRAAVAVEEAKRRVLVAGWIFAVLQVRPGAQ